MSIGKDETFRRLLDKCRFSFLHYMKNEISLEDSEKELRDLVDYIDKYVEERVNDKEHNPS